MIALGFYYSYIGLPAGESPQADGAFFRDTPTTAADGTVVRSDNLEPARTSERHTVHRSQLAVRRSPLTPQTVCVLQAHLVVVLRNVTIAHLCVERAKQLCCALTFLTTRHEFNGTSESSTQCLKLAETECFEAAHVLRRQLVTWRRSASM